MTDELKPCPFCGGEAVVEHDKMLWYPSCSDEDCMGYAIENGLATKREAIAAWNRRSTPEPATALEKLKGYVRHDSNCDQRWGRQSDGSKHPCDCGLTALLEGIDDAADAVKRREWEKE